MYKRIAKSFAGSVILVALVFFMLGDDCNVSGTSCIYCGGNGQKLEFKDCPLCTNGLISGTNPVGEKVFYWCQIVTEPVESGALWTVPIVLMGSFRKYQC